MALVLRMHRSPAGTCWANSPYLPGYLAIGANFQQVMDYVHDSFRTEEHGDVSRFIDFRWQWCDQQETAVRAVTLRTTTASGSVELPGPKYPPCPCELRRVQSIGVVVEPA